MSIAKPTIMTAVPRFYQNLYSKINANLVSKAGFKKVYLLIEQFFEVN